MSIFAGLVAATAGFVDSFGILGAFIVSIFESFIFPVPTAVFIAPMTALGVNPLLLTVICTIGSVIGAVIGYYLGKHLGNPVAVRLFKQHRVDKVKKWFDKWGAWAVFIAAFTPIPFKVFTWCGGIFKIKLKYFILASIAGRFLQFFIAAYVGNLLGPSFLALLGA